ncbi:MAG: hypothetical protein M3327_05350 [Actinomycetota bacterium]|nr:hypothetical protein [Actinomycetota bacterium]
MAEADVKRTIDAVWRIESARLIAGLARIVAGDSWMRTELLEEALRLGRILAGLIPAESEVYGLVAARPS